MDVIGSHAGILHATGFRIGRGRIYTYKNTANILMKNFVDFMLGSLLYWFIGFGIMFGLGDFFELLIS